MDKRALWSKIFVAVASILTVRGLVPLWGWYIHKETSLLTGHGVALTQAEAEGLSSGVTFLLLGNILALIGAILSKSSRRKLVLWGLGGTAAGMAFGIAKVTFAAFTDKELPLPPIVNILIAFSFNLVQIVIIIGAILLLLEPKRPATLPSQNS